MERIKKYVDVITEFSADGKIRPLEVLWDDGTRYEIDKILSVDRRASLKVGGAGIRYTCQINGVRTFLYLEENKWFVEAKVMQ
ncbi:hypothetical protein [Fumia xinanensis]|uniref:Uncharacterized protein n=1 Tax=Fumia xinanensis TaxID=2763659 RepID=A0A926I6N7_9FIRM|nr:hypothetical protein [Fumia xinanensis]MBC8559184.1 hypothetical protein [Fumia xinanensis]